MMANMGFHLEAGYKSNQKVIGGVPAQNICASSLPIGISSHAYQIL